MWLRDLLDYFLIKASGYFDPRYYLLSYRDCRLADVDPLWHFVRHGWREGRNPSADFDTAYYLLTNPDVRQTGCNPLVHYLRYGQREGRSPRASQSSPSIPCKVHKRPGAIQQLIYILGSKIYWIIPPKYRGYLLHWSYSHLSFLFTGTPDYEAWRSRHTYSNYPPLFSDLVDLQTVQPIEEVKGDIAIHLHVFYSDLAKEIAEYLRNMPFRYDLYVSVSDDHALAICIQVFSDLPQLQRVEVERVPNRGRDIAPFVCIFGEKLSRYRYVAHLHTKKSLYNQGATEGWRTYLYRALLGSPEQIRRIFTLMQQERPYGIVYPQNYALLPYWANTWLANRELGRIWATRLGIKELPSGYFDYPASSMFWARSEALAPLFSAGIKLSDFPEEQGQTDGTLAHTIERLFALCSLSIGMPPAIIKDTHNPSWSPWRLDHYVTRSYSSLINTLHLPQIKLIGFDVFDTLFCRPLLNPETTKKIVARHLGERLGQLYQSYRHIAEQQARHTKKQDIDLTDIYRQFGRLTNLPEGELQELQQLEERIEEKLVQTRQEAFELYQEALNTKNPVILITDMFLPRKRLEAMLRKHGIHGWKELFISGEVGLRKDEGRLYQYIFAKYELKPSKFLMIGDNERSDIQIPCDLGSLFIHLMRPVELARGLPRLSQIIQAHEQSGDLDAELTLGLIVQKNFSPIHFPSFDPASLIPIVTPYNIGYSLVGPLLVSFAQWLVQQSYTDGISRLYFLSREGKLIKEVFDFWTSGLTSVASSNYLVISRRAASVAAVHNFEDILNIAKTEYYQNTAERFLYFRYGLVLDEARWEEIGQTTGWTRRSLLSVSRYGQVNHLHSLLKAVEKDILEKASQERSALLRYLDEQGLGRDDCQGVVDIGYSGSIQKYLNRLIQKKVHGYYLMTDARATEVAEVYNVLLRGCFCENALRTPHAPAIYRFSFDIEKLLSTNEPQIEYYSVGVAGQLKANYRELDYQSSEEPYLLREEIRKGALDYARDARQIRQEILPDFQPSTWTARMLIENFLEQTSPKEKELLQKIILDDHYCGRGLVA